MSSAVSIVTNLDPDDVRCYAGDNPGAFSTALAGAYREGTDPNVPAERLNLGFQQEDGKWHQPGTTPSQSDLYRWEFRPGSGGGVAMVTPAGGSCQPIEIPLTPRAELTAEDLQWIATHSLIVEPVAAALAVYHLQEVRDDMVGVTAIDHDANERVMRNILSGGSAGAGLLGIRPHAELDNLVAVAAAMDTACRTPQMMDPAFIETILAWYDSKFPEATLWLGTGSEHVPAAQRKPHALRDGLIGMDAYIEARRKQLDIVLEMGERRHPILFPDQMQAEYGAQNNIQTINALLGVSPNNIVLHKLGSPFNALTDYLTLEVLRATAHLAYAVKSSDPRLPMQIEDYRAVRAACEKTTSPVVLFTGDDRGFPFDWVFGAQQQLEQHRKAGQDNTAPRNGFTFVRDANTSALLGYLNLNLHQTIVAIVRLSQWYDEMKKGEGCNQQKAKGYLDQYWALMAPAMGLSTDSFFGKWDPTPAYTWRAEMAYRFTGVLQDRDGEVLPHRATKWSDSLDRRVLAGRLLAWMVVSGAITAEELPAVLGANRARLER
jgi:hypothetical protein